MSGIEEARTSTDRGSTSTNPPFTIQISTKATPIRVLRTQNQLSLHRIPMHVSKLFTSCLTAGDGPQACGGRDIGDAEPLIAGYAEKRVSRNELNLEPTVGGLLSGERQRRLCHVDAQNRQSQRGDVKSVLAGPARLEKLLRTEDIRASVLRASTPTHKREAWYREQLKRGIDVAICHPKLVETGLDQLEFPTILFHETGYSLHTLRQASRRSWCIGQRRPVDVKFFAYIGTMQEVCLRLMGKKLLVALAMEGKFASEAAGDQAMPVREPSRGKKRQVGSRADGNENERLPVGEAGSGRAIRIHGMDA